MSRIWASITMAWCMFWHEDHVFTNESESFVWCEECGREWRAK